MNSADFVKWADAELAVLRERVGLVEQIREAALKLGLPIEPPPKRVRPEPVPKAEPVAIENGSLEGAVMEALNYEPMTKSALAEKFEVEPKVIEKVLNKLRSEGEVEPGHSRQGWRRV